MSKTAPDREVEERIGGGTLSVAGCDEAGRGSAAGPCVVGAVVSGPGPAPDGIRDSKLLTRTRRSELEHQIKDWAAAWAVGEASAEEIDTLGMTAALTLAANRALADLKPTPGAVLLDGPFNYIKGDWAVTTMVKADLACLCVAAASILAKEHHDAVLQDLADRYPVYGLDQNVGYLSPGHLAALTEHGPVPGLHRLSWKYVDGLPGFEHMRLPLPGKKRPTMPEPALF